MDDLTRRNMLKYLAKGAAAGISMSTLISCSKDFGIFEPTSPTILDQGGSLLKPSQADLKKAEKIVTKLCQYNANGYLLGGKYHDLKNQAVSEMKDVTINFPETGWDSALVIDNFKIASNYIVGKEIIVEVAYDCLGEINGEDIAKYKNPYTAFYLLSKSEMGFSVSFDHGPCIARSTAHASVSETIASDIKHKDKTLNQRNESGIKWLKRKIKIYKNDARRMKFYVRELEKQENGFYQTRDYELRLNRLQNILSTIDNI